MTSFAIGMGKVRQIVFFASICLTLSGWAQDKVKYQASGTMEVFKRKGVKVQRLTENVVFTQKTTTIYCDSAFFYRSTNSMEAFGRVRIVDDSVTITSRELYYDGNSRKAQLRKNVVYTKGQNRLTTNFLDYDMDAEISHYFNGGKLQDSTNTLTSQIGYYYAQAKYADFHKDVVLVAPDYTLKSQDLHYDTRTKIATTPGATEIITDEGKTTLHSNGGEFRTEREQSLFVEGQVETPNNYLEGDDLFFDQANKYYKAIGHVKLIAKNKDVIITGDEGYNDEKNQLSKIYGNPVMRRIMKEDTLYMSADTLVYIESDIDSLKKILAYSNVKVFKQNLQGKADSAVYYLADSMIYMFEEPVLWSKKNQITSDTIRIQIANNTLDKMYLRKNAFMVSQDTIKNFNQVKGRNMIAHFASGNIRQVDVMGNGESIYYVLAEGDSITLGMNRILCSDLKIRFENKEIKDISAYVKPEARFIPPHELTADVQRLDGFIWRGNEQPTLEEVLRLVSVEAEPVEKPAPPLEKVRLQREGMPAQKNVKKPSRGEQ